MAAATSERTNLRCLLRLMLGSTAARVLAYGRPRDVQQLSDFVSGEQLVQRAIPLRLDCRQMGSAAGSSDGEGGPLRAGGVDLL